MDVGFLMKHRGCRRAVCLICCSQSNNLIYLDSALLWAASTWRTALTAYRSEIQTSACSSSPLPCWNLGDGAWRRAGAQMDVTVFFFIHQLWKRMNHRNVLVQFVDLKGCPLLLCDARQNTTSVFSIKSQILSHYYIIYTLVLHHYYQWYKKFLFFFNITNYSEAMWRIAHSYNNIVI